jgi:hypothetical protein
MYFCPYIINYYVLSSPFVEGCLDFMNHDSYNHLKTNFFRCLKSQVHEETCTNFHGLTK